MARDAGVWLSTATAWQHPAPSSLAGWAAQEKERGEEAAYPLAGLVISGFGSQSMPLPREKGTQTPPHPPPEYIDFPIDLKDARMIPEGTADPAIYEQSGRLHESLPYLEIRDYKAIWADGRWRELCGRVKVPVMIGLAELDVLWEGTEEHVKEFAGGFAGSERVDASVVIGAPHCIELSYWAQGWYARCFGWALECAAAYAAKERGVKEGERREP